MANRRTTSSATSSTQPAADPRVVGQEASIGRSLTKARLDRPRFPATPLPVHASTAATSAAAGDSKQARLVTLLRRKEGATLAELMAATGWLSHSVRGALSAVLKRKLGLAIESAPEPDRGRVYRIAAPPVAKPSCPRRPKTTGAAA